jgi:hypothetical protein
VQDGPVQLEHIVDTETARDALVSERRVQIAVADDIRAALERRCDHALDELGASGREERGLRPRRHLGPLQQQPPDALPELGAAGLAGRHHLAAGLDKVRTEQLCLGRLAGAVQPLEGHEHAAP